MAQQIFYRPGSMGGGPYGSFETVGQDPGIVGAYTQMQSQKEATAAQERAARLQADTARRQAELQYNAAIYPEMMKQQRFSQILGGGTPGGGKVNIQPYPWLSPGGGGGQAQAYFNIPGAGLAAPPNVPGSALAPQPPAGGGGFGGGFGGFFGGVGGGGGGGGGGQFDVDRTLPEFSADPFSSSRQGLAVNAMRGSAGRQLGTEQKNIAEQAAARGYGGSSPQVMALQSRARQASRAGQLSQEQEIGNQYNMGRAQLEQQRQGLISQRRTDIDKARAQMLSAQYGPQAQLFSSLLGAI